MTEPIGLVYHTEAERVTAEKALKALFRLHDIHTKEVAYVDRAANLRRFIMVKRAGGKDGMDGLTIKTISESIQKSFVTVLSGLMERMKFTYEAIKNIEVSKDEKLPMSENVGTALRGFISELGSLLEANPVTKQDGEKHGLNLLNAEDLEVAQKAVSEISKEESLSEPVKDAVIKMLEHAQGRIKTVVEAVKAATIDPKADPLPSDVLKELREVGQLVQSVIAKAPAADKKDHKKKPMKKRGAKMSKARKEQVKRALEILSSVLKEVDIIKSDNPFDGLQALRSPTDAKWPNGGSGHQSDLATVSDAKAFMSTVPGLAGLMKEQVQEKVDVELSAKVKAAVDAAMKNRSKELETLKTDLKTVRADLNTKEAALTQKSTQVEKQAKKLAKMGVVVQTPNGGDHTDIQKQANPPWAMDMSAETQKVGVDFES